MTLTMEDELLHYGVPGMKWGKRAARATGSAAKAYGRGTLNRTIHPIKTLKAEVKDTIKNPHTLAIRTPKDMRRINKDVANRVSSARKTKANDRLKRAQGERDYVKASFDKKVAKRKKGTASNIRAVQERERAVNAFDKKVAKRKQYANRA